MIDPAYYAGRTLYLVPDGPIGFKPYALLLRVMAEQGRYAFAQVVFSGKEQVTLLRPVGNLLAMSGVFPDYPARSFATPALTARW